MLNKEGLLKELEKMGINDPVTLGAIKNVPREEFVPESLKKFAYENSPLAIGNQQTISQPYMVALMTQSLKLEPDQKVLEIGTGSGYQAAILSYLQAAVYSIERIFSLHFQAKKRLQQLGYSANLFYMDGSNGLKDEAPFDRIIVTAASPDFPVQLEKQLNQENGILVVPVGDEWEVQKLVTVSYVNGKRYEEEGIYCRFVPLKKGLKEL